MKKTCPECFGPLTYVGQAVEDPTIALYQCPLGHNGRVSKYASAAEKRREGVRYLSKTVRPQFMEPDQPDGWAFEVGPEQIARTERAAKRAANFHVPANHASWCEVNIPASLAERPPRRFGGSPTVESLGRYVSTGRFGYYDEHGRWKEGLDFMESLTDSRCNCPRNPVARSLRRLGAYQPEQPAERIAA